MSKFIVGPGSHLTIATQDCTQMYIERRLVTYIALLIATVYYFFGKAEAATPPAELIPICQTSPSTPRPGDYQVTAVVTVGY